MRLILVTLWSTSLLLSAGSLTASPDTSKPTSTVDTRSTPRTLSEQSGVLWKRIDNDKQESNTLVYFPTLVIGTAVIYNLPGVRAPICLSSEALAGIYAGRIISWNDKGIAKTNPGLTLPSSRIRVLQRDDESGMSALLDQYLSNVNSSIGPRRMNTYPSVSKPAFVHGEDQMIARILRTPYSVGFADFYSVRNGRAAFASLQNKDGACELPSAASLSAAASAASLDLHFRSELSALDVSVRDAYPITGFSGLIVPVYSSNADRRSNTTLDLLHYILTDGQKLASESGYIALPRPLVEQELRALGTIMNQ